MNQIPASYYKRAAEIMSNIPDVDFMNIVTVLYAHDTWIAKQNETNEQKFSLASNENEPNKTPMQFHRRGRHRERITMINGYTKVYPNMASMFRENGLKRKANSCLPHHNPSADEFVKREAELVFQAFQEVGKHLSEYKLFDFDGNLRAFNFPLKGIPHD